MAQTMFDRYGGFAKISRIVSSFYDKIIESPVTRPYFDGIDMRRLVDHQIKFIASVMGGPASYSNDALERLHARLHVTDEAFLEMAQLLRETLEDFDFEPADIDAVYQDILSRKRWIVAR